MEKPLLKKLLSIVSSASLFFPVFKKEENGNSRVKGSKKISWRKNNSQFCQLFVHCHEWVLTNKICCIFEYWSESNSDIVVLSNVLCECWLVSRILLVLWWWVSCNVIIFCYGEAAGNEWDYCNLIITDINASWTLQINKEKNDWKFLVRGQGGGGRNLRSFSIFMFHGSFFTFFFL